MTAPLLEVLVERPGPAFGRAFEDPAHGCLHPVDLALARREHDAFTELLTSLGPTVHELGAETGSPDLVYQFDPLLVTDRGAIPLRSGKPNRRGEELVVESWTLGRGIPTAGRIKAPGTVDGGIRSGSGRISCASDERSGRTTRERAAWQRSSAATSASSISRTGAATRSWSIS
jgi:N-dimethylarginine dimethylaminohydrolase